MTMPHSLGSGMPGNPGNVPVYPGNVAGNPYTDMQPAPQVAAPPSHGLVVASICLGVIGIILCAGGLFFGAYTSFDAHDSFERAMAPLNFILVVAMVYILGGIMNIIGLVLGKAAGAGSASREGVHGGDLAECSPDDSVSGCRDPGRPLDDGD